MSTEKLSELSKPVFEIEISDGYWLNCSISPLQPRDGAKFNGWPDGVNRLYSQEYVSALLAELEAKDKRILELDYLRLSACEVFKEIGNELGCNPDNESIMMAIDELKKRLATPVRLPDDLEPNTEPCVICGVVSSHPEGWHYCHPKCGKGDA